MARTNISKIRVVGHKNHYQLFLSEVHKQGSVELISNESFKSESQSNFEVSGVGYDLARINASLNFLQPYTPKKDFLTSLLTGGKVIVSEKEAQNRFEAFSDYAEVADNVLSLEESKVRHENQLRHNKELLAIIEAMQGFSASFEPSFNTETTGSFIGYLSEADYEVFQAEVSKTFSLIDLQKMGSSDKQVFFRITTDKSLADEVEKMLMEKSFAAFDFAAFDRFFGMNTQEINRELIKQNHRIDHDLKEVETKVQALASHYDDLAIAYDVLSWKKAQIEAKDLMFTTENVFAFEAWIATSELKAFQKWLKHSFVGQVAAEVIDLEENEEPPAYLHNKTGIKYFEPIVQMYGLPKNREIDPTILIAPFFFLFFGLCLSDVGYGAILAFLSGTLLFFGKYPTPVKKAFGLTFLCGLSAVLGGIILGGYFGMTTAQLPILVNPATGAFYGQLLNPIEGSGPMLFLVVALGMGCVHLLFGLILDFVHRLGLKDYDGAFGDSLPWLCFFSSLVAFGVSKGIGISSPLFAYAVYVGVAMILLTQGRSQKNIFMKGLFGIFGLYNATAYLSDVLSYSRIMALGLATGVVGFAMNLTAGVFAELMPHPVLGAVVAIAVIIFGHTLNFSLSLLGAFIHSARLQYIEFFGKFYQGGANQFVPFKREMKYLYLEN